MRSSARVITLLYLQRTRRNRRKLVQNLRGTGGRTRARTRRARTSCSSSTARPRTSSSASPAASRRSRATPTTTASSSRRSSCAGSDPTREKFGLSLNDNPCPISGFYPLHVAAANHQRSTAPTRVTRVTARSSGTRRPLTQRAHSHIRRKDTFRDTHRLLAECGG